LVEFQTGADADSRLRWRCRRGLLELDLVLQAFLSSGYSGLTKEERVHFDQLLALPDDSLLSYLQGRRHPDDSNLKKLIKKIK